LRHEFASESAILCVQVASGPSRLCELGFADWEAPHRKRPHILRRRSFSIGVCFWNPSSHISVLYFIDLSLLFVHFVFPCFPGFSCCCSTSTATVSLGQFNHKRLNLILCFLIAVLLLVCDYTAFGISPREAVQTKAAETKFSTDWGSGMIDGF